MAFKKTANAEVVDLITARQWEKMQGAKAFNIKTSGLSKVAANRSKYLLSHASILASVAVEDAPYDHLIKPESSIFVNQNNDAWSTAVVKLSYKTFIGAFNFEEHYQNTKAAKGHILDAVLRRVNLTPTVSIVYVDILVATDLIHEDLINRIKSEKTKYLSMGCTTSCVFCSYCGVRCTDPHTYCSHLLYDKGDFKLDDAGVPRRIAELCGHSSLPGGGVMFVEASWVGTPAFPGASHHYEIAEEWIGPASPYTHKIPDLSVTAGIRKAASTSLIIDPKTNAFFNRKFR